MTNNKLPIKAQPVSSSQTQKPTDAIAALELLREEKRKADLERLQGSMDKVGTAKVVTNMNQGTSTVNYKDNNQAKPKEEAKYNVNPIKPQETDEDEPILVLGDDDLDMDEPENNQANAQLNPKAELMPELTTEEDFMETYGSHGTNGQKKSIEKILQAQPLNTEGRINQVYIPKSRRGLWTESKYNFATDVAEATRNDLYIQHGTEATKMLIGMHSPEFDMTVSLDDFNLTHYLNLEQILDDKLQTSRGKEPFSAHKKKQAMSQTRKDVGFFLKGYFLGRESIERESLDDIDYLDLRPKREDNDTIFKKVLETYAIRNGITIDIEALNNDPMRILNALPPSESQEIITAATLSYNLFKKLEEDILEKHGEKKETKNKNGTITTTFEHNDLTKSLVIDQKYAKLIRKEEEKTRNFELKIMSAVDDDVLSAEEYSELKGEAQHLGISISETTHDAEHTIRQIYEAYRIRHNNETEGSRTSIELSLSNYLGFAAQFIHNLAIDAKENFRITNEKIKYNTNNQRPVSDSERSKAKKLAELVERTGMADKKDIDMENSELFKYALGIATENHTKFALTQEAKKKVRELYEKGLANSDPIALEAIKNTSRYTELDVAEKLLNKEGYVIMEREDVEMFKHEFHPFVVVEYSDNNVKIYKPNSSLFTPEKNNGSLGELDLEGTIEQFVENEKLVQTKQAKGIMHLNLDKKVSVFIKKDEYDALKEEKRLAEEKKNAILDLSEEDLAKPVVVRMNLWDQTSPVMDYIAANKIQSVALDTRAIIAAKNLNNALFDDELIKNTTEGYIVIPMSASYNESGGRTFDYTQVLIGRLNPAFQPKERVREIGEDGYQFILSRAYIVDVKEIEKTLEGKVEPSMENVKPQKGFVRTVRKKEDVPSVEAKNNTLIVEVYRNPEAKMRVYRDSSVRAHISGNHESALGILFYSDGSHINAIPLNDDPYGNLHLKDGKAQKIAEPDKEKMKQSLPYEGMKSMYREAI